MEFSSSKMHCSLFLQP